MGGGRPSTENLAQHYRNKQGGYTKLGPQSNIVFSKKGFESRIPGSKQFQNIGIILMMNDCGEVGGRQLHGRLTTSLHVFRSSLKFPENSERWNYVVKVAEPSKRRRPVKVSHCSVVRAGPEEAQYDADSRMERRKKTDVFFFFFRRQINAVSPQK